MTTKKTDKANSLERLKTALIETVKNSDLENVSVELAETFTDSALNEGLLKEIPILGTILGITKAGISLKDRLFIKKVIYFLSELNQITLEDRKSFIEDIESSNRKEINVGEKLIYILDKCDDHRHARYLAQFFCAFLNKELTYSEFLRGASIIQNIFIKDLEYFLESNISEIEKIAPVEEAPNEIEFPLINAGICGFGYSKIKVENQWDYKSHEQYNVEGGDAVIWVTTIGNLLKEKLKVINSAC